MGRNDIAGARSTFRRIPADKLPADFLYAPYRLQQQLAPGEPNEYRDPLLRAVHAAVVPALIRARVLAAEGDLGPALEAYAKTDPADWTSYDLQSFRLLRLHAGYAGETGTMLLAAIKANRMAEKLRAPVAALLRAAGGGPAAGAFDPQLTQLLQAQPALRAAVTAGIVRQLQLRQKFIRRDYAGLLADHAGTAPASLGDETVLLLVLAAASERNPTAWAVWSQELRRRYRDPEVEKWLHSLPTAPL